MYWIQFLHTLHLSLCISQTSSNLHTSFFLYCAFVTGVTGDFYTKDTHWCPFLLEYHNLLVLSESRFPPVLGMEDAHTRNNFTPQHARTEVCHSCVVVCRGASIPSTRHQSCHCFQKCLSSLCIDLYACLTQDSVLQIILLISISAPIAAFHIEPSTS